MGALRKFMPITVGHASSSAGWPSPACRRSPASGRRTRSSPTPATRAQVLWFVGLVTALLTAFYMSRQVFHGLLRRGPLGRGPSASPCRCTRRRARPCRRRRAVDTLADRPHADDHGHAATPHESPWMMTVPLVVLAIGAVVGGLLNLPFAGHDVPPASWLEPVVGRQRAPTLAVRPSDASGSSLAIGRRSSPSCGIVLGYLVYERAPPQGRRARVPGQRLVLRRGASPRSWADPGDEAFDGRRLVRRARSSTAPSTASGTGVTRRRRDACGGCRAGYVRNYALGIGVGAVLLLGLVRGRGASCSMDALPAPDRDHRAARRSARSSSR